MTETESSNIDSGNFRRVIYLDLEWTCWDGPVPGGRYPEIIEIGVVELDCRSLEITREAGYLVRPRHLDISPECTRITGLTAEDLKHAARFAEVFAQLDNEFEPKGKLCGTWGNDAEIFAQACRKHGLRSPIRNVVDVSQVFWRLFLQRQQPSLASAVKALGISSDGAAHMALADARNTALVHAEMVRRIRCEAGPKTEPVACTSTFPISTAHFGEMLRQALRGSNPRLQKG